LTTVVASLTFAASAGAANDVYRVLPRQAGRVKIEKKSEASEAVSGRINERSYIDETSKRPLPEQVDLIRTKRQMLSPAPEESVRKMLRKGDILLGSHDHNITGGHFSHAALVSNAEQGEILEDTVIPPSLTEPGARRNVWKDWIATFSYVALVRINKTDVTEGEFDAVVQWARDRLGRPFRYPATSIHKENDSAMYCSQYVWLAFKRAMAIDLDDDGGWLVTPDDLYDTTNVQPVAALAGGTADAKSEKSEAVLPRPVSRRGRSPD